MRVMCFIDGENLVFRYQEMVKAGLKPNCGSTKHIQDVFIWHPHLRGFENNVLRVNYYTSAVGTEERIDEIREENGKQVTIGVGHAPTGQPRIAQRFNAG